ncbi:MAG: hypothetical protein HY587_05005 [Candidatus Omnitrophica bacterium]|nr:hypothetical protein [Candidatus Omnitrophota bacterium]
MKKICVTIGMLIMSVFITQVPAMAKTIKGMVLDVEASAITIAPDIEEGAAEAPEDVLVTVAPETKLTGVTSVDELMIGDEVVVEAEPGTEPNSWKAASVELTGLEDFELEEPLEEEPAATVTPQQ